tara:strand:- start:412 stop:648 length:237 start_codon:yes stop_codon:yes gene_type:complete
MPPKYVHSRKIYRITIRDQIPELFDNGYMEKGDKFFGKIGGVEARVEFSEKESCSLSAKTEEDLEIVYRKTLEILIRR